MNFLFSLGSLYDRPWEFSVEVARESGFDGVEWVYSSKVDPEQAISVVGELPILSVHSPFFVSRSITTLKSGFLMAVDFAKKVKARVVVLHPPCVVDPQVKYLFFFLRTRDFSKYGEGKVIISLENMPYWGRPGRKFSAYLGGTIGGLYKICKKKRLFITFDVCHMGTKYPEYVVEAFNVLYRTGLIVNIHFSDYSEGSEHLLPGQGILPLDDFLVNLGKVGYEGLFTLELRPQVLPKAKADIVAKLKDVLVYCKEKIEEGKSLSNR